MAYSIANNQLLRKHFQEIKRIIDIPNLIDIQKNSYQRFLQADLPASARQNHRSGGGFPLGIPDPGFQRDLLARVCRVHAGDAEVRR